MQSALVPETNFRRAMENSMLTGMRAMDLEGRITYVNAAFCAMTGWTETELVGRTPPFPYWPQRPHRGERAPAAAGAAGPQPGRRHRGAVMRKDGIAVRRAHVRLAADRRRAGTQTGWMTSMTDITEPKRIRDQLSASHERFTTVLEGLDASVSVLSVQQGELLFANSSYRLWFGADSQRPCAAGQRQPAATMRLARTRSTTTVDACRGLPTQELTEAGADPREVYVETAGASGSTCARATCSGSTAGWRRW